MPQNLDGLEDDLDAAQEDGDKVEFAAVQKRIADFKARQQGRPKVSEEYTVIVEVPAGGNTEADFDLPQ